MSDRSNETASSSDSRRGSGYPNGEMLVDGEWLSRHLADSNLRILDLRTRDEYDDGHIPNAISAPVGIFKRTVDDVPAMVVSKETFEKTMGQLGVSNDSTVVIYAESNGQDSGRLFWTLEYFGHEDVRVLDGGIAQWQQEGRPVTDKEPEIEQTEYVAKPQPDRFATWQDVKAEHRTGRLGHPGRPQPEGVHR